MAIVAMEIEIPLEVQEDLERLAKLGLFGRGPVDVAERLLIEQVRLVARITFGASRPGDPPRRGILHDHVSDPTT